MKHGRAGVHPPLRIRLHWQWRHPHRTLRCLCKLLRMNNLQWDTEFPFPIPFTISIWTQSDFAGLPGPAVDGWRIGLHPVNCLPAALVPLLGLDLNRARLLTVRCGGRRDLPPHHRTGGVRRQGWTGDIPPAWNGRGRPGIMTVWRRSVVTITATRSGDAQGRRGDAGARVGRRERWLGGVDPRGAEGGGGARGSAGRRREFAEIWGRACTRRGIYAS